MQRTMEMDISDEAAAAALFDLITTSPSFRPT